jgi:hypothetical protein
VNLGNLGRIDRDKLVRLAKSSGITREELERALVARRLLNVTYISGGRDR